MIDITQADVNALVVGALKIGAVVAYFLVTGILIWGSFRGEDNSERSDTRMYLFGWLIATCMVGGFIWYMTLPATRGAQ